MKNQVVEKNKDIRLICPLCNSKTHEWKDVYFDSESVLKKTEKQYIAHCQSTNQYVLSNQVIDSV